MKKKNFWLRAMSMLVMLLLIVINSNDGICYADDESDISWVAYVNGDISDTVVSPGDTLTISVPVTANYFQNIKKIRISLKDKPDTETDTPITVTGTPALYKEGYGTTVTTLNQDKYTLKFSVQVSDTATAGTYSLGVTFVTGYVDLKSYTMEDTIPVTVKSSSEKSIADLAITNVKYTDNISYKGTGTISYTLTNLGDQTAKNIIISYDGFSDDGILPDGTDTTKKLSSLAGGASQDYVVPVKGSENAVSGAKKLTISVSYKNTSTATELSSESENLYITVAGKSETESTTTVTKAPKLVISNVTQSPEKPKAEGTVTLSFTIKNVGTRSAKSIEISASNLSNTTLMPVSEEPYYYVKNLEIDAAKKVTLKYKLSSKIEAGMSELDLALSYKDSYGTDYTDTAKLYVKKIQNEEDDDTGVPKLIIQDYGADTDSIKAGSDFNFTFDIVNTHGSLSADNIKVTISSDDGTFSVTKGSNSFYISKINPGEGVKKTIPLKVKADSTTKSYPLKIQFEYEYEGMEKPTDTLTSGLTISETLNIQVEEDPKPVLTNIIPGGYGDLVVGESNSVNFDFTNHGKSSLYNVEAVITGDFVPTQQSYFIGTVEAGGGKTHEMEITPQTEGTGKGVITITYEDSNGKQGKIKKSFTADVMSSGGTDISGDFSGMVTDSTDMQQSKKPIVKLPLFIMIQIILFFAGMLIVKKVIIWLYKKKLMKKEEELN